MCAATTERRPPVEPRGLIFSLSAVQSFRLSFTMADPKILETFPNPAPHRDFLIEHTHHEFTSVCPMTGHPDFAAITVRYVADKTCVELKSLKLYFHAYRNEGIFFEAATNKICDELGAALKPRSLTIIADWKARGGFSSRITADWKPAKKRR
jgi:7-cyano-7-deazaguanine reductase